MSHIEGRAAAVLSDPGTYRMQLPYLGRLAKWPDCRIQQQGQISGLSGEENRQLRECWKGNFSALPPFVMQIYMCLCFS